MGVLEYFSLYLAGIVVFRVTFAVFHTCKWRWRFAFNKKYKIQSYNLEKNFKEMKKQARTGGESTDDELMEEAAEKIFIKHQGTIKKKAESTGGYSGVHDISTQDGRLGAALDYMHEEMKKDESSEDE